MMKPIFSKETHPKGPKRGPPIYSIEDGEKGQNFHRYIGALEDLERMEVDLFRFHGSHFRFLGWYLLSYRR